MPDSGELHALRKEVHYLRSRLSRSQSVEVENAALHLTVAKLEQENITLKDAVGILQRKLLDADESTLLQAARIVEASRRQRARSAEQRMFDSPQPHHAHANGSALLLTAHGRSGMDSSSPGPRSSVRLSSLSPSRYSPSLLLQSSRRGGDGGSISIGRRSPQLLSPMTRSTLLKHRHTLDAKYLPYSVSQSPSSSQQQQQGLSASPSTSAEKGLRPGDDHVVVGGVRAPDSSSSLLFLSHISNGSSSSNSAASPQLLRHSGAVPYPPLPMTAQQLRGGGVPSAAGRGAPPVSHWGAATQSRREEDDDDDDRHHASPRIAVIRSQSRDRLSFSQARPMSPSLTPPRTTDVYASPSYTGGAAASSGGDSAAALHHTPPPQRRWIPPPSPPRGPNAVRLLSSNEPYQLTNGSKFPPRSVPLSSSLPPQQQQHSVSAIDVEVSEITSALYSPRSVAEGGAAARGSTLDEEEEEEFLRTLRGEAQDEGAKTSTMFSPSPPRRSAPSPMPQHPYGALLERAAQSPAVVVPTSRSSTPVQHSSKQRLPAPRTSTLTQLPVNSVVVRPTGGLKPRPASPTVKQQQQQQQQPAQRISSSASQRSLSPNTVSTTVPTNTASTTALSHKPKGMMGVPPSSRPLSRDRGPSPIVPQLHRSSSSSSSPTNNVLPRPEHPLAASSGAHIAEDDAERDRRPTSLPVMKKLAMKMTGRPPTPPPSLFTREALRQHDRETQHAAEKGEQDDALTAEGISAAEWAARFAMPAREQQNAAGRAASRSPSPTLSFTVEEELNQGIERRLAELLMC